MSRIKAIAWSVFEWSQLSRIWPCLPFVAALDCYSKSEPWERCHGLSDPWRWATIFFVVWFVRSVRPVPKQKGTPST